MEAGLYIHIPFCLKRCNYCDFYTFGGNTEVSQEYVSKIKNEILKYPNIKWKTIYFGGGTPSLLSPQQVEYILSGLDIADNAEITLEANPETATFDKFIGFRKAGINRLSIGVQTAKNKSLETIGRVHRIDKVYNAFKIAREAGFENISGDLMLGLPDYTYQELDDTIDLLSSLGVTHISAYMLKIEDGTPFGKNEPKNLPNEDAMSDFYIYACNKLESKGYKQYEISNFAKDGYQSQHNNIYWKLENYIGIGPSAHSCFNGKRFFYPRDLNQFIETPKIIEDGDVDVDEYIMLSLRLKTGLNLDELKTKWGKELTSIQLKKLKLLEEQEFINFTNNTISLTPKGFLMENAISCEIML